MGNRTSSDPPIVASVDDLTASGVDEVLARAREHQAGIGLDHRPFTTGLLFETSSLRTRVGFAVATARLGGTAVEVVGPRFSPGMTSGESFGDTLRTLGGMVDVVVTRTSEACDVELVRGSCPAAYVNAGDGGNEHPTQALIDLLAMREEKGPVGQLRLAVCGDLRMRSVRSLLALLGRRPPEKLVLLAPEERRDHGVALSPALAEKVTWRSPGEVEDVDVLYLAGLPEQRGDSRLSAPVRASYAFTSEVAAALPADAVVLCPLPVIDEISDDVRADRRLRAFEQSDRGVHVRSALLSLLLEPGWDGVRR